MKQAQERKIGPHSIGRGPFGKPLSDQHLQSKLSREFIFAKLQDAHTLIYPEASNLIQASKNLGWSLFAIFGNYEKDKEPAPAALDLLATRCTKLEAAIKSCSAKLEEISVHFGQPAGRSGTLKFTSQEHEIVYASMQHYMNNLGSLIILVKALERGLPGREKKHKVEEYAHLALNTTNRLERVLSNMADPTDFKFLPSPNENTRYLDLEYKPKIQKGRVVQMISEVYLRISPQLGELLRLCQQIETAHSGGNAALRKKEMRLQAQLLLDAVKAFPTELFKTMPGMGVTHETVSATLSHFLNNRLTGLKGNSGAFLNNTREEAEFMSNLRNSIKDLKTIRANLQNPSNVGLKVYNSPSSEQEIHFLDLLPAKKAA